jgi:TP901 family phage tail tape measure protein
MSDVNFTMDISSFVKGTADILKLTAQQKRALNDLIVTTANLDKEGKARVAYTEAQISANQRLTATLKNNGEGWEVEARAIKSTTQALQRQRDELQKVLSVDIRKQVGKISASRGVVFNTDELARIEKIKTTIGKLDTEVVRPDVIKAFFDNIKAGNIPEATGALARLRDELVKLNRVQEQARARQSREGALGAPGVSESELRSRAATRARVFQATFQSHILGDISNKFGVDLTKVTLQNENQIRQIGARIAGIMRRSISEDTNRIVDNTSLRKLLPDLLSGNKLDFINKPELQAAAGQLGQLIGLFERLKKAQDAASTPSAASAARASKAGVAKIQDAESLRFLGSGFNGSIQKALEAQFSIRPSELTRKQEEAIKQAYANIAKTIRRSSTNLDLPEVSNIFNNLLKGTAGIPATAELQRVYEQLNRIIGVYERLRQQKDRKTRTDQDSVDQTLLSTREARALESRIRGVQANISRGLSPLKTALTGIDASLGGNNPKLDALSRKIGELGAKAGLSGRQVVDLFERFNAGNLTAAEQKFQRIFALFAKINSETTRLRQEAADKVGKTGTLPNVIAGGGGIIPNRPITANLPPNDGNIAKVKEFEGIWQKLRNSFDYFLIYRGINVLTDQLSQAATRARALQVQISLIRTISQESQQSFGRWQQDLLAVSNETGLEITDVANAAYDAVSNQVARGRQVTDFLRVAGDLARTTNSSLQDSVNLLSSSINAFGRDVSEAETSAARFFRAIDLGRFKAADIANVFGRVGFVGRDLGVKEEEILAVISTLTRSGVTADDAITLLTNAMNKLTNPTEKMKNLLNEWGFGGSGRVAVQTEGFVNILQRMIGVVQTGRVELTDLFNEIRGEKFASAFRNFGGQINRDLVEIRDNSPQTYANARVIRGESDADKINKQINELKNSLTATFGNELTNLLKQVIEATGGVQNLVSALTAAARIGLIGASAFAAYKAAMLATGGAVAIYNGILSVSSTIQTASLALTGRAATVKAIETATTAANTVTQAANTAAVRANAAAYVAHPLGLLLAGAAAVYAYWQTSTYNIGLQTEAVRELNQAYDNLQRTQRTQRETTVFEDIGRQNERVQDGLRRVSSGLSRALSAANTDLEVSRRRSGETANALREGFDRYSQFARDRISDIAREFNRLDDRMKASNKSMLDIREAARQAYFQAGVQYSGGFDFDQFQQREQLLREEREQIRNQIARNFAAGDDESVQAARQLGRRLIDLNKEIFDLRVERQRMQAEQYNRANGVSGRTFIGVNRGELAGANNEDIDFLDQQETAFRARTRRSAGQQQATEIRMRARLESAQRAVNEINSINIFNNSGGVLPEFEDRVSGRVDINRVRQRVEEIRRRIKSGLDPEALRQAGPEIDRLIDERFSALTAEINTTQAVENLRNRQNEVVTGINRMSQAMTAARTNVQQYAGDIQNLANQFSTITTAIGQQAPALTSGLVSDILNRNAQGEGGAVGAGIGRLAYLGREQFMNLGRSLNRRVGNENAAGGQFTEQAEASIREYQTRAAQTGQLFQNLATNTVTRNGVQLIDQDKVEEAIRALEQLLQTGRELAAQAGGGAAGAARLREQLGIPQAEALLTQYRQQLLLSTGRYNGAATQLEILQTQSAGIGAGIDAAVTGLREIPTTGAGAQRTMAEIAASAERAARAVGGISGALERFQTPGQAGGAGARTAEGVPQLGGRMAGGDIYGYAAGGGIGSDSQLVATQAGEYIWNRTATRRFYPQISSGNNIGRTPVEFHVQAGDTINVGGVSINEAKDGQLSAAQMDRMFRRNQRRS